MPDTLQVNKHADANVDLQRFNVVWHEAQCKYKLWTSFVFMNTYLLYPCSSFPDSKEQYPDFPFKNGGVGGAIELKRPVGAHCHGTKALACEDSVDKMLAKKKLYIASAVCLVFMIGEVIGKGRILNYSG